MSRLSLPLRLFTLSFAVTLLSASSSAAGFGDCGQPLTGGSKPSASDALGVLKAAVGAVACAVCVCDANGDGKVSSPDALRVLQVAVGGAAALDCLVCRNEATIGPAGGTLSSKDGAVSILFPAGAIDEDTEVSIEGAAKSSLGAALFANGDARAYRLEPESLELSAGLTVRVNRDDATLPGAGTFGTKLVLFVTRRDGVLEGLADQRVDVQAGEADATATLDHFSTFGVLPLHVTAKVLNVPAVIDAETNWPITAQVSVGANESVVAIAEARYVDGDFGAWQTTDGFALDDPLEETFSGLYGDSYDYVCTQQIFVGFNGGIDLTLDVIADVENPPTGIETSMRFETTIQCNE